MELLFQFSFVVESGYASEYGLQAWPDPLLPFHTSDPNTVHLFSGKLLNIKSAI